MAVATLILIYAFAVFVLALSLTALFGPWLAFLLKVFEISGKKVFLGFISRQTARMNLWFGGLFAVLVLSSLFQGFFRLTKNLPPPELMTGAAEAGVVMPPSMSAMAIMTGAFVIYVFLLAVAHFGWKNLRQRPALQAVLLLLGALCGWAALGLAFNIAVDRPQILNSYYYLSIFTWTGAMYPFGSPTSASSALMIIKFVSAGLGVAAAMGMCCANIFRARDDFGRDYYNFAMRHLSRWAFASTAVTLASGLGMMLILRSLISVHFDLGLTDAALGVLIYASCCVFWLAIMRSPTPLRHKAGLWISLIALLVAMLGHLIFVRNFFVATGMISGMLPFN